MLYTIGHSNHSLDEFLDMLQAYQIQQVIDVRTIPKSRHMPWFSKDNLKLSLRKEKISYHHLPKLGGLRHAKKDSINDGWHNASFRGYADYMQTNEFFEGLKELMELMKNKKTAIMCAEAVPWRCHRSMIADALIVRHIAVSDIMSKTSLHKHELTSFARIKKGTRPLKIYYPASQISFDI